MKRIIQYGLPVISVWLFLLLSLGSAMNVDEEFAFARGLVEEGLPDYALRVVDRVVERHPDQRERAILARAEIMIARRRFDDAQKLLGELPADKPQAEAIRLAIGTGYARIGNIEQAREIYSGFFERYQDRVPDDPDLLRVYQEASYEFGQLLEQVGDREGAARAYERTLASNLDDTGAERRLMTDLARLYLTLARESTGDRRNEFLDKTWEMAEEIQWGGQDLWFGRSIPIMAYVELERGNESRARELLEQYMDDLRSIDHALRDQNFPRALSPMATARFLLGELYDKQFQRLRDQGARPSDILQALQLSLTEYYNVFAQYGASEWGPAAGIRGQELVDLLREEYGRDVNIQFGDLLDEAIEAQFRLADNLFRQRKYEEAIREYLRILTGYPETEPSLRALSNVLLGYIRQDNDLYARMTAAYLAERFAGRDIAARALLVAANHYRTEREDEDMYMSLYETYLAHFPEHDRAPAVMFDLARMKANRGDREGAHTFYERIIERYPRHSRALQARFALAWSQYQVEDFESAIEHFEGFVNEAPPGHEKVRAQFLLADSHQRRQDYREAIRGYNRIVQWVGDPQSPYNARPADAERNAGLLERAYFHIGYGFGRISEPEDQIPNFRSRAIAAYDQFLELYPDSRLAPRAMFDKGQIQLGMGESRAATDTFEELAGRYPESEEGQSALFALVTAALENELYDIARDAFNQMVESPDAYSPEEFTRVGQAMLNAKLYETVIPAYRQVVQTTDDDGLLQRALFGLGQAYHEQGNHEEAVQQLGVLLERFPRSPFFYDAKFIKSRAHIELGQHDTAQAELSDILRLSQDNVRNQHAQFELGRLQRQIDEKDRALASFLRIALLQDPTDRELRPIIEESLKQAIELSMELERYEEVEDISQQYLNDFPQGKHVDFVREQRREGRRRAVAGGASPAGGGASP